LEGLLDSAATAHPTRSPPTTTTTPRPACLAFSFYILYPIFFFLFLSLFPSSLGKVLLIAFAFHSFCFESRSHTVNLL
jgi:hypothetical protein